MFSGVPEDFRAGHTVGEQHDAQSRLDGELVHGRSCVAVEAIGPDSPNDSA